MNHCHMNIRELLNIQLNFLFFSSPIFFLLSQIRTICCSNIPSSNLFDYRWWCSTTFALQQYKYTNVNVGLNTVGFSVLYQYAAIMFERTNANNESNGESFLTNKAYSNGIITNCIYLFLCQGHGYDSWISTIEKNWNFVVVFRWEQGIESKHTRRGRSHIIGARWYKKNWIFNKRSRRYFLSAAKNNFE